MKRISPFLGSRENFILHLLDNGELSLVNFLNSIVDNEHVDFSKRNQRANAPYSYEEDYYFVAMTLEMHTFEFMSKIFLRSPNSLRTRLAFLTGTSSWLTLATLSKEAKAKIRNYFQYCYCNQISYELRVNILETVELLEILHYFNFDASDCDRAREEC
jgi:hypothetical protein